jgi:hypothetical protein
MANDVLSLSEVVNAFGGAVETRQNGEIKVRCPICSHRSLWLKDKPPVVGWCDSCNQEAINNAIRECTGTPPNGRKRAKAKAIPKPTAQTPIAPPWEQWIPLTQNTWEIVKQARAARDSYMPRIDTLRRLDVREAAGRPAAPHAQVAFPFTLGDQLPQDTVGFAAEAADLTPAIERFNILTDAIERLWYQAGPKRQDVVFGLEPGGFQLLHEVWLVEGVWDAACLIEHGYSAWAIAVAGQSDLHPALWALLGQAHTIYVVPDNDPGRKISFSKLLAKMPEVYTRVVSLPDGIKDICMLRNHTSESSFRAILAASTNISAEIRPRIYVEETTEADGKPADLGEEVLAACPILKTFVDLTLPYVETDINNIICDFLAAAGAAIGLKVYARHLYDMHPAATYHLLIANTTVGKGTVWGCVNELFRIAVADWKKCLRTSARSQQALYRALKEAADPELITDNADGDEESKPNPNPDYTSGSILLRFSEVSAVFKSMRAEWSTMSQALRETYDGRPVSNELGQKDKSTKVDNPYALSLLGDVSPWELSEVISDVDFASGVANRFVWCVSHQTKTIPRAGPAPDYRALAERLRRVIPAEQIGEITYSKDGEAAWDAWVLSLPANDDGRLGSACGRMRANALRLAVLFAVLDERRLVFPEALCIRAEHVNAAAAILNRHRATVQWFLERPAAMPAGLPEPKKDKLWQQIEKLRAALKNGRITNNELHTLFSNQTAQERKEIAKAASLNYTDEVDEKGNSVGVWE